MRGVRSQYTQPPNGSFSGMPSCNTRTRPAPFAPSPRADGPCVVGLAIKLLLRRNKVNPGTCLSASSSVGAVRMSKSRAVKSMVLVALSATRVGCRSAMTRTVSPTGASFNFTRRGSCDWQQASVAAENPGADTVIVPRFPSLSTRNFPVRSECAITRVFPELSSMVALGITAPCWSITVPRTWEAYRLKEKIEARQVKILIRASRLLAFKVSGLSENKFHPSILDVPIS